MDLITISAMVFLAYSSFQYGQPFIGVILLLTAAIMAKGNPPAVSRAEGGGAPASQQPVVINQPMEYPEVSNYQFRPNWSGQDMAWYMTEQIANAAFIPYKAIKYIIDQLKRNV